MSHINDALRRLAGATTPETRSPSFLEGLPSEGNSTKSEDVTRRATSEARKLATFVPSGLHPVGGRPPAPKVPVEAPTPRRPEQAVIGPQPEPDVEQLVDVRQIADYTGYLFRSVGRHKMLTLTTFLLTFALAVGAALLIPKTYYVKVTLLAQRNAVMTALSNPGRAVPWDADAPTRAAAETILRRDNLIALVKQTDLLRHWDRTRAPVLKLKDWLMARITRYELTPADRLDLLIRRLEDNMIVSAGPVGDGTVTIELFWPNAEMAHQLVEGAQRAFLEARQSAETSAITESIAILERYSATLHQDVNRTLTELQRTQARDRVVSARGLSAVPPRRSTTTPIPQAESGAQLADLSARPDPELIRIKNELDAKRQELPGLEEARARQLADLQARLATLKTVYTASHPSVMTLQQNIDAFQHESPQITALKASIEDLLMKYDDRLAADPVTQAELKRRMAPPPAPLPDLPAEQAQSPSQRNEVAQFADLRLKTELNQLQSILERTDGARIELAVSEAAFKYRYTVITPAQVPRQPSFPNLRALIIAGFLISLMLAVGVALGTDLKGGRILEAWQVKRQLGLTVLGTARIA